MTILQEEMDRLFAAEVRRMQRIMVAYDDTTGSMALSYAHELQAMWRRAQGTCQADAGVADGEMLNAVRRALGRSPR
jgi:hypothetical protein